MPKIDLTGKQYEYFKVIKRNETATKFNGRNVFWDCECQCGNIFTTTTTNINKQKVKSCGCMNKILISQAHFQDITGQVFGELIAIERDYNYPNEAKKPRTLWKCQCSCGNIISIDRTHLVNRGQSSCGCKNSIGELNINKILNNNNIAYKSQYTNTDLKTNNNGYLRFDFAILDKQQNVIRLIEFDGIQHFENVDFFQNKNIKYRDTLKNQYAKDNNIPLVRIPYYKRDCLTLEDIMGDQFLI